MVNYVCIETRVPQLMWILVVNELLTNLSEGGNDCQGYADEVQFENILSVII